MLDLPPPLAAQLLEALLGRRNPAFLVVAHDGRLRAWGGALEAYGMRTLEAGRPLARQVDFLDGLVPVTANIMVPRLEVAAGVWADLHLLQGDEGDWVVLLDTTWEAAHHRVVQQLRNELQLLREELARRPEAAATPPAEAMPGADVAPTFRDLCAAVRVLALCRGPDGSFRLASTVPAWFAALFPAVAQATGPIRLVAISPFVENFHLDAEEHWRKALVGPLRSGPWQEVDESGRTHHLEATAVCLPRTALLLLERLGAEHDETASMLQRSRAARLEHYRLLKELEQKEVLLHCIVHDLAAPAASIQGALQVVAREALAPDVKELVEMGVQQAVRQLGLIDEILTVFASERQTFAEPGADALASPDVARSVTAVADALAPAFVAKNVAVRLDPPLDPARDWTVAAEPTHLERVLFNLLENALRHGPEGSAVTVGVHDDGDFVRTTIDDEGPGVAGDDTERIFDKLARGSRGSPGKVGLGLYFCRITVQRWKGTIGCEPRPRGGARFWFRLPRPTPRRAGGCGGSHSGALVRPGKSPLLGAPRTIERRDRAALGARPSQRAPTGLPDGRASARSTAATAAL